MAREIEVRFDGVMHGTPEETWAAITTGTAGWLWPVTYEPRLGGEESGLTGSGGVTAWDPPRHFATRAEGESSWYNNLDYRLEPRGGGTLLHYVHTTVLLEHETADAEEDACRQHTAFYYHTLDEYLTHFAGQPVRYVAIDAPRSSTGPGAFLALRRELGIEEDAAAGARLHIDLPELEPAEATIDYLAANFIGLRTADALIRLFGRDAWGWPIGVALHLFPSETAPERHEQAWRSLLDRVFAGM